MAESRAVKALFLEATRIPPEEREGFLEQACHDAPELRREVEELLEFHERDDTVAERLHQLEATLARDALAEAIPEIANYRVRQAIGEGGMGSVYEAEQLEPVNRKVAVKVLKRGLDTRQIVSRFEAERQALARMDHPNVARVLDAGESRDGRPFFAMELVHGKPITTFSNHERLHIEQRLRLFIDACHAVHHAHQKGIVHRDLKPSNVLVETFDEKPVVKIIDFGIAKALQSQGEAQTELGQRLGTPGYMSPEQARGSDDIDTRADVYSLGVLLYELLTDRLPWNAGDADRGSDDSLTSASQSRETVRPSVCIRRLGEEAASLAEARGTDSAALRRALERELDWITLRALEPDRDRRYSSVSALADDVQRYLDKLPVQAGPPTASYRIRKFVARHRFGAVAALALTVVTLLGLVGTTLGLLNARRAESEARVQARTAGEVVQFLLDIFQSSDPFATQPAELSARDLLERGRAQIDERLEDEPQVRSALLGAMGQVYSRMGLLEESEPLLEQALRVLRQDDSASAQDVAAGALRLADLFRSQGRLDDAEPLLVEAIELLDRGAGDADHRAAARQQLGVILRDRGELEDARTLLEESLSLREEAFGRNHTKVGHSLYHLGWLEFRSGNSEASEELYRRALAIWQTELGPEHASTGWTHNDLGVVLAAQNRLEEALTHYQQAVAIHRKRLGESHPALAAPLHNLGNLYGDLGRYDEAVSSLRQAIAIREASLGPQHPELAGSLDALGFQLRRLGRYEEARVQLERGLEMVAATLGEESPGYASQLNNLASLEREVDQPEKARSLMERALAIQLETLGEDNPQIAMTLSNLATVEYSLGEYRTAADRLERALALRANDAVASAWTQCQLAHSYDRLQLETQARAAVRSGLELIAAPAAEGHVSAADIRVTCFLLGARLEARAGQRAQASEMLLEAKKLLAREPGHETAGALEMQAAAHALLGEADVAIGYLRRSIEGGVARQHIRSSADYDSLQHDPRYVQLMGREGGP